MEITVLNKRTLSDPLPGVTRVYVGRPSPLGNPFEIGRDGDRNTVIAKYSRWLHAKALASSAAGERTNAETRKVRLALHDLLDSARKGPLELVCWCAPQACHADVISRCLQWLDIHYEASRE